MSTQNKTYSVGIIRNGAANTQSTGWPSFSEACDVCKMLLPDESVNFFIVYSENTAVILKRSRVESWKESPADESKAEAEAK